MLGKIEKERYLKYSKRSSIFVLGVIVTLAITQGWEKYFPEDPVFVKEVNDSVRVVHEYSFPNQDSAISEKLKNQIKNLKLLNDYEEQVERRIKNIQSTNDNIVPNLITVDAKDKYKMEGYTYGNASPYFQLKCPNINDPEFLDFRFNFFNNKITEQIAFIRMNVIKYEKISDSDSKYLILDEFYAVKQNNNLIRVENNFGRGKYQFKVGFTFKKDLSKKYPIFYFKRCTVTKS